MFDRVPHWGMFCLLLLLPLWATGQQTDNCTPSIQLVGVEVNRSAAFVGLELLARGPDCAAMKNLQASDIRVTERIAGAAEREVEVIRMGLRERFDTLDVKRERVAIHFLVDISNAAALSTSKILIREFLTSYPELEASYFLRPFASTLGEEIAFEPTNAEAVLGTLQPPGRPPFLSGTLLAALHELENSVDPQFLFIFSSGRNVPPDYTGLPRLPPRDQDVYTAAAATDPHIFAIVTDTAGIAGATNTLRLLDELPAHTTHTGAVSVDRLPGAVAEAFGSERRLLASHFVEVRSTDPVFSGRQRSYSVTDLSNPEMVATAISVRKGSFNDRFRLGRLAGGSSWLVPILVGLLGVGGLLAVFYFLVPLYRSGRFERTHVVPYAPSSGRRILDPLTREPVAVGTPVVNVCAVEVPLQTWRDCGGQCPHYPGCTNNNLQCDGAGRGESLDFFALNGVNRRLNWIWFGAVGGFVGWLLFALVAGVGAGGIQALTDALPNYMNAETLVRDTVLGACFGLGLTLLLAIMEERSQSRRISWKRIALRSALGAVVATLAFGFGLWLLDSGGGVRPVVAAAVSWLLFGLGLGAVLTVRSTIDRRRGLLGGLLAGVVGFFVYGVFAALLGGGGTAQVLSLLVAGGLLGLVLDTVVVLAEEYEIEYLTPVNYQRSVPLSKWLKNEWDITIGSQPGSQIYVKWNDEDVLPEHAQISLEGGRIYLLPIGETLVNGRIVNEQKRTQLNSGDTLRLGRRGMTQMRFWAR